MKKHNYIIKGYKPEKLFRYFEDICRIPRGSGNEKEISDYLVEFAKERGLEYYQDSSYNVLIKMPATAMYADQPSILLQGHVDMVCEKNSETVHDFVHDPIVPYVDGKYLKATGTTLGGDDGVAVASMMTLLDGELEEHPALECLFTTSEETGLTGAYNFDYSQIHSRRMINMDSENDSHVIVGCAGGVRSDITFEYLTAPVPSEYTTVMLKIKGLMGGHSGENINCGRANANKLMGQLLSDVFKVTDVRISAINGGSKDNAIPRECCALISVRNFNAAQNAVRTTVQKIKETLREDDSEFSVEMDISESSTSFASFSASEKIIGFLNKIPNGVLAMSSRIKGLVEFSRNIGIIKTVGNTIDFIFSSRSAIEKQLDDSINELDVVLSAEYTSGNDLSVKTSHYSRYPGWEYVSNSKLCNSFVNNYRELYNKTPLIESIHAGLECGIIFSKLPGMDIISIGPNLKDIHSPAETLDLESFERFYKILCKVILDKN